MKTKVAEEKTVTIAEWEGEKGVGEVEVPEVNN